MMHFLAANWPYGLVIVLLLGVAIPILIDTNELPTWTLDEDAREIATGHRDHEQPGGVL